VTARLTLDYRSSAKIGEWLQVHLDDVREDGRKTHATGRLMAAERVVAQAEVLFIDASTAHA
jgi:acyl-CoA thioesterase FadM